MMTAAENPMKIMNSHNDTTITNDDDDDILLLIVPTKRLDSSCHPQSPTLTSVILLFFSIVLFAFPIWITMISSSSTTTLSLSFSSTAAACDIMLVVVDVPNLQIMIPRLASSSLTLYMSFCCGYMGITHLGFR